MDVKKRKLLARTVQELYLYPSRTKGENALRGIAWIASWLVGVVLQNSIDQRALGGAYFIYAVSLLLEFVPIERHCSVSRFIHGVFCTLQTVMLVGAVVMIFGDTSVPIAGIIGINKLWIVGWIIVIMIFIAVVLAFMDVHKCIYDEETERLLKEKAERERNRAMFLDRLNGCEKGGNGQ